jgi:hypothetical protein
MTAPRTDWPSKPLRRNRRTTPCRLLERDLAADVTRKKKAAPTAALLAVEVRELARRITFVLNRRLATNSIASSLNINARSCNRCDATRPRRSCGAQSTTSGSNRLRSPHARACWSTRWRRSPRAMCVGTGWRVCAGFVCVCVVVRDDFVSESLEVTVASSCRGRRARRASSTTSRLFSSSPTRTAVAHSRATRESCATANSLIRTAVTHDCCSREEPVCPTSSLLQRSRDPWSRANFSRRAVYR